MNRQTQIAFAYLYGFRKTVPPLAAVGSVVAWLFGWNALAAGLVCIAVGELLESSYYINVLRWAERATPPQGTHRCMPSWRPSA